METRVTLNESEIMKVCNFIKNDVEKSRVDYLTQYNQLKQARY